MALLRIISVNHDAANRFSLMHEVESSIDVLELQSVGNHGVNLDTIVHVPVDNLRNIGSAPGAAECGAPPNPAGHQLERPRRDLLTCAGDPDDDGFAPTLVAGLERNAHHLRIADAFEGIIGAAARQLDQMRNQIAAYLARIDEMRHAEPAAPVFLIIVEIDADDHVCADKPQPLNDVEAYAAKPEHDAVRSRFHFCRVDNRADAGGDATADIANLVERRVVADLRDRDLRQHRIVREG